MTIEKAIQIIDAAIQNKQDKKTGLLDPNQLWNKSPDNFFADLVKGLVEVQEKEIEWLQAIKDQLEPKKRTRHADKKT